jgi:hypothetical protein
MRLRISTVLFSASLSIGVTFAQFSHAITGTVADTMCSAHHMMQGKTPAQCTRECTKQGSERFDPLLRPQRGVDGRWTTDAWAPLDGRVFNGGVRMHF